MGLYCIYRVLIDTYLKFTLHYMKFYDTMHCSTLPENTGSAFLNRLEKRVSPA